MCGNVVANACGHIVSNCAYPGAVAYGGNVTACTLGLGGIAGQWGSTQGAPANNEDSIECRVYHAIAGWNKGTPTPGTDVHCNHTYSPSGYTGVCSSTIAVNAQHHCDTTLSYCTNAGVAQYNNLQQCLNTFSTFSNTANDARASNAANDQGCPQYHTQAAAAGAGDFHCTHGGPSGQYVCGGNGGTLDALRAIAKNPWCAAANLSIYSNALEAAFGTWARADLAMVIPTGGNSSVPGPNYMTASSGDTDFCRIYHCTVSTTDTTHCEHCSITSSTCFAAGVPPGIAAVCRMIQTACGTTNFADVPTCISKLGPVAGARPGDNMTLTPALTDTFACRAYQAGVALATKNSAGAAAAAAGPCMSAKDTAGPGCGGAAAPPAKSDAAALFVSAALALPFLM